ncbi:MAG: hypothetical protein COC19_00360 [SAR86 cluster bacterium]|uniref:YdhG-like domain-containing protein n=1 Tax=SAR86 cluster bacterium TaxID=2030880 RepID=A0A2A4MWR2_9GAMM|nr:MAG: hypothetical protein COC19_00360 [SAR86 cluster bacterium]
MVQLKTQENDASVLEFLNTVANKTRQKDSLVVTELMAKASLERAKMWGGSIIGFGKHHYKYADGRDANICKIGFSPRANSLVFYLGNFEHRQALLNRLGKHRVSGSNGVGCLYINKLDDIDLPVLEEIFNNAFHHSKH